MRRTAETQRENLKPEIAAQKSKLMPLRDAIAQFVPNGSSVVMGAALEASIPFGAGHEIIRQRVHDLTLVGPISDILFDQLIGAGCVQKVIAAWVGNVSAGLGHNYRRALEEGTPHRLQVWDHSNFSIALALLAGGLGAPYIPTYSLLGSDLLKTNPAFVQAESPIGGEKTLLVPALRPDVAILHVQRSDESGNAHAWGSLGISEEAALASQRVIVVAEEIVPRTVILSDPNRVLAPGFKVCAVVHEPGGAHPSPVQGYYNRDHEFYHEYHRMTRTVEGNARWLGDWIMGVEDRAEYLNKLGGERWRALLLKEHHYAAPVDYGY
jgi:glutaconate CoA-transferase subunit A